ncbi:hypothetical protein ACSNOH_33795, partial [Streptomyces sp. URMC 127]|uniref:hypothetical protein n=1 Tax=Streptomyces sp. URMC 127 TaxID=3423402 RepID=UPI003F1C5718
MGIPRGSRRGRRRTVYHPCSGRPALLSAAGSGPRSEEREPVHDLTYGDVEKAAARIAGRTRPVAVTPAD